MYTTRPADLADALEKLAARLRDVDDLAPVQLAASVNIQAHEFWGTTNERKNAVDDIVRMVGLSLPVMKSSDSFGNPSLTGRQHQLGPIDVMVFTSVKSEREAELERENEALRAQLAAAKDGDQ